MDAFPVKWARGLRLRERFALQLGTASALVAIIVGTALYLHGQYAQNSLQTASLSTTREALLELPVDRLKSVAKRLARSIGKPDIWDNADKMPDRLEATREAAGLTEVRIFTWDGTPLYVGPRRADADDQLPPEWSRSVTRTNIWITHRNDIRIYAAGPIRYRGQFRGILLISKSILPVEQEVEYLEAQLRALNEIRQAESRRLAVIIGGALVLLAVGTGILLARRMAAPILRLQSITARIAGGDFDVGETVHRADELGDLAQSVEHMAEQLDTTTVSREFFSQVIEGMLDGLAVVTRSGKITMTNGAAGHLTGLPAEKLIGKAISSFISRDSAGGISPAGSNTYILTRLNGHKIPVLVTASKVHLHQHDEESLVFVFRDISEIIAHQVQLQEALTSAQAANKTRSEFMANMSHELRTPLNAIIGFSEILSSDSARDLAPPQRIEYAADIQASGKHLLHIINDVLLLSKIEVGDMTVQADEVNVAHLVRSIETLTRPKATESGLDFTVRFNVDDHRVIDADEVKLKHILNNLLSNAVKFTPSPGKVSLAVDQDKDDLVFTIADTGIGMTAEELELAFQPFRQADNSHTRKYEGTGLGLPLARRLTELHGGQIKVISGKNQGTTVTVRVPLKYASVAGLAA